jgi:formylglycine-generating enzyme required for sulfatase activity
LFFTFKERTAFQMILRHILFSACLSVSAAAMGQNLKSYDQSIKGSPVTFKMVAIPGGKFQIGSNSSMADPDESPRKEVELSPFWMGEHEVTFEEWDLYFNDASVPQSKNIDGITRATPQYIDLTWGMGREAKQPANSMSQQAAMMYCQWLYAKTGFFFRLPTEAEWEYACRSGEPEVLDPEAVKLRGWFKDNSDSEFQPVKGKKPTAWGLYDMLGNLSEWTIDQYNPTYYSAIALKDPVTVPASRYPRTVRGGAFTDKITELRCSNRIASDAKWNQRDPQVPKSRWWLTDAKFVGFRVVRPAKQPSKSEIESFYQLYNK